MALLDAGPQGAHVGIDDLVRQVHRHIVILIAVARVEQNRLVHVLELDERIKRFSRVAVCAVGFGPQAHAFTGHKLFNHMRPAVAEFARVDAVARIIVGHGGRAQQNINSGKAGVAGNVVERAGSAADFDARFGMSDVEIGAR